MTEDDLQIGDTWTAPEHRGKGLANFAVQEIIKQQKQWKRGFWYVVEEDNLSSIRVIEKAGFRRLGEGTRKSRMGMRFLGSYSVERHYPESSTRG